MKIASITIFLLLCTKLVFAGMGACHDGSGNIASVTLPDGSIKLLLEIDANSAAFGGFNCEYFSLPPTDETKFNRILNVLQTVQKKYIKWDVEPVEMTQGEKDAVDAAEAAVIETALRNDSKAQFDGQHVTALALRCEAKAIIDELNTLRTWTRDLKAAIAAASTLAQVKTNVAALSTLNDRTLAQAKTAIQNCIDAGTADE